MMLRIERIYGSVNIRVTLAGGSGIILWSGFYIFAQVRVYGKNETGSKHRQIKLSERI